MNFNTPKKPNRLWQTIIFSTFNVTTALLVLAICACSQAKSTGKTDGQNISKTWKSAADLNGLWTSLERDEKGYLVYAPCDGTTPRIKIARGFITVYPKIEPPEKLRIKKISMSRNRKEINFSALNKMIEMDFTAKIADAARNLVLWTIDGEKRVMTPAAFEKRFRFVDNPCPDTKKQEKDFLPVEFK